MFELRAVHLTLLHLEQEIFSQKVLYINKEGGVVSKTLNDQVGALYKWAIPGSLHLQAVH